MALNHYRAVQNGSDSGQHVQPLPPGQQQVPVEQHWH
jgi:hypothetical protein